MGSSGLHVRRGSSRGRARRFTGVFVYGPHLIALVLLELRELRDFFRKHSRCTNVFSVSPPTGSQAMGQGKTLSIVAGARAPHSWIFIGLLLGFRSPVY